MKAPFATRGVLVGTVAGLLVALQLGACKSTVPNSDPTGRPFPSVVGRSLEGEEVRLPEACEGGPAVLLLGYVQKAQFDADRWLYGLLQADLGTAVYEVPTIPGLFPRALAGTIDSGMRSGIPSEDWGSVVTVYGSAAEELVAFTGNENPRNIRVLLLDAEGRVIWFHDRGFSAGVLIDLEQRARAESGPGAG
jgi:hypothetical protein